MTLDPLVQLRWLMSGTEALLTFLDREGLTAWLDWGTLLGYQRHRGIIPWDYDADLCLLDDHYGLLMDLFMREGKGVVRCAGTGLTLRLDAYGDPSGCMAVAMRDCPDPELVIDLVAYRIDGPQVRHCMSKAVAADYPGAYDQRTEGVFPLRRGWFLGRRAWVPAQPEDRLVELFGDGWRDYPDGHTASEVTAWPLWEIPVDPQPPPAAGVPYIARGRTGRTGDGTRLVRVLDAATVASVRARGRDPHDALGGTFTDAVWRDDRALWGHIGVGCIEDGDTLVLPEGCVARTVRERAVPHEDPQELPCRP